MIRFVLLLCLLPGVIVCNAQGTRAMTHFQLDSAMSDSLCTIVKAVGLDSTFDTGEDGKEKISLAVVDLTDRQPIMAGVNPNDFLYPASVYKMFVAMEVLKEISNGDYDLTSRYIVKLSNAVDNEKEITWDPRPLLQAGDTVTINYLLDLMITRSDNSAANCLIDVATRDSINETMHQYGWYGSEVTRKFLAREYEDSAYKNIRGTETCAMHAADFMYLIHTRALVNPWVSMQLEALLGRQLDTTKLSEGLPRCTMFYHKTGWWSLLDKRCGHS